jgi:hypothetical protein
LIISENLLLRSWKDQIKNTLNYIRLCYVLNNYSFKIVKKIIVILLVIKIIKLIFLSVGHVLFKIDIIIYLIGITREKLS